MTEECLLEERVDAVAVLTLNRPYARNAVDVELTKRLEAAMDRLEGDDSVWVVVLTGAPPVFCAGADLTVVDEGRIGDLETERGGFAGLAARQRSKPLIAAVDGPALAGGAELVLAADLVVASRAASFGLPEVKRSLVAAAGGMFRLGRKIPLNIAMECVLTGDPIRAQRAADLGLVNVLCEPGEAREQALALAARICANGPRAVEEARRVVVHGTYAADDDAWRLSKIAMERVLATDDVREGVRAFLEKRAPVWSGA